MHSMFCMQGPVLRTLYRLVLTFFYPQSNHMNRVELLSPFYRWGNLGTQRFSNLHKDSIKAVLLQKLYLAILPLGNCLPELFVAAPVFWLPIVALKNYPKTWWLKTATTLSNLMVVLVSGLAGWFSVQRGIKRVRAGCVWLEARLIWRVLEIIPPAWPLDGDTWKVGVSGEPSFSMWSQGLSLSSQRNQGGNRQSI